MERREVLDARWVDNGPGWLGLLPGGAEQVLGLEAAGIDQSVGAVGHHPDGSEAAFEVRAFLPATGGWTEDPVTGSLKASMAEWLVAAGRAHPP